MKTFNKTLSMLIALAMLATLLASCAMDTDNVLDDGTKTAASAPNVSLGEEPENVAVLAADMSLGSADGEELGLISRYEYGFDGAISVDTLAQGLTELTGLDFALNESNVEDGSISVDWSANASFIVGLGDTPQKDEFFVYDHESLAWFMMDSLYRTIIENFGGEDLEVFYSNDGGQPIALELSYPPTFPADTPYMGSPFYYAHAEGLDDGDLPYWNGFDFGPNLVYSESYEIEGDPGDYLSAAEAAKLSFDTMKEEGFVPEYSDSVQYEMILIDLADINDEECYVYRLDIDEPSGTLGAAYAYAYQSGNIYMQGYGGQWVMPE